jgi:S1-C subfamily serine protease
MTRKQLAVPLVAALLGGAVTAAAIQAGGTGTEPSTQGLLTVSSGDGRLSAREIFDRAAPGVVYIRAQPVQPAQASAFDAAARNNGLAVSTGSGFVLDDEGRLVTNAHVVSGVADVQVTFADGRTVPARVLGKDEETDLAVLAVDPDQGLDLRPLELGDSDGVQPGDQAVAIGNPSGFEATAGTGRVSAADQRIEAPGGYVIDGVFETDAVIEPATSGGPLLGADGRVIGVMSRLPDDDRAPTFAVPSNTARQVLAELEENHKVIRPYLGLRGDGGGGGVVIAGVYPGSPAEAAGLRVDDVVEAVDGREVRTAIELQEQVAGRRPGEVVRLRVLRDGSSGDVEVRLAERPATLPPP